MAFPLTAETDPATLVRALTRLPEKRCEARFVYERESCTETWDGGACGWDRREGKGLWVTRAGEPYPTFFGSHVNPWRSAVRAEVALRWLSLRPASPEALVLRDAVLEQDASLGALPAPLLAWKLRDSADALLCTLARQALEQLSTTEQVAASWAARR